MKKNFIDMRGYPVLKLQLDPGEQLCLMRKTEYGEELVYCSSNANLIFEFSYNLEKTKAVSLVISSKYEACGSICNFDYWYVDKTKKWGEE